MVVHSMQATLILPRTGERVKRNFTLRPDSQPNGHDDERTPLLGQQSSQPKGPSKLRQAYAFATSKTGIGIFKCSIAYLLGSLATFVPAIAGLLGKNDGKHMAATVAVYFHPARSAGSMLQAFVLAWIAFVYAAVVDFSSMGISVFFGQQDLIVVGHTIILLVFCGGGLGFVAWTKQKMGHPLVNVVSNVDLRLQATEINSY